MRSTLLSCVAWLGALQSWRLPLSAGVDDTARIVGLASVLGTVTVLVYRLGVWRQEMQNTRDNVTREVKAHRDESATNFDRIERRLEAIDHMLAASSEHRVRTVRWQARTNRRLDRMEENEQPEATE